MSIFFRLVGPRNAYSLGLRWWLIPLPLGGAARLNSYIRIRAISDVWVWW